MKRTNVKMKMLQTIALFLILAAAVLGRANVVYAQGPTWDNNRPADLVLGQPDFATGAAGTSQTALGQPYAVAVDPTTGKVFVADTNNHRVLRYASSTALLNGAAAEGVLGQADFASGSANAGGAVGQDTLYSPVSVFVDSTGRLWVGDYENNRVLWWNNAATQGLFANANGVLGQADFTTGTANNGGLSANTLYHPYGVWVDESGDLWVVDSYNHRVLRWDDAATLTNGEAADGVLGQPDFTSNAANGGGSTAANSLNNPTGLVVSADGTLFVGDTSNHRVLRFANAAAKANGADADGVLGQPDFTANAAAVTRSGMASPYGVALDPDGRLFVVDYHAHRVTIYENAAAKADGADADGVLGQPDFTTGTPNTGGRSARTLNFPVLAFYDPALPALWVGDVGNHRVLAYGYGVTVEEAGNGMGTITRSPDQRLYAPGTEVTLSVVDLGYDNELIWSAAGCSGSGACTLTLDDYKVVTATILRRQADLVLGQPTFSEGRGGTSPTTFDAPHAVAVDPATGKVFVADYDNHRVLRYASSTALRNGDPAEGVLGQPDFVSNSPNRGGAPAANTLYHPTGLAVDSAGRLWVVDQYNHRVLWFDDAASKADGANADGVLGQPNFTSNAAATTQSGMWYPYDVFVDDAGHLWVADTDNHRVLRFDDAHIKANGTPADGVLGQPDFTTRNVAVSQNGMAGTLGVVVSADGTLFVADSNRRVLRFDNAAAKANGAPADGVLGQHTFTSNGINLTDWGMNEPWGLALAPDGRLFVVDRHHHRILIHENAANKADGAPADGVLGQPDFTTGTPNTGGRSAATLNHPVWIWYDPDMDILWAADAGNNRVLAYSRLSVYTAGNGTGQVSRIPDQRLFDPGSSVTLVPEPDPGSTFAGWGGACSGTGDCTVTLDAVRTVQATFTWKGGPTWDNNRPADLVLGQTDFATGDAGTSQTALKSSYAATVDPTTGKVFVADTSNHRVLRYASSTALRNGAAAEGVLGQADFVSGAVNRGGAAAANTLYAPIGVVVDNAGRLWVADYGNNRVLWFDDAANKVDGAPADGVLGQADFTGSAINRGGAVAANTLYSPYGVWVDGSGNLWVVDPYNHRVLRWDDAATLTNGEAADGVLGQADFTSNAANRGGSTAANSLNIPTGLVVSADGTLFVSDLDNTRVLRFDNAAGKPDGAAADGVLGQTLFTTAAENLTQSGMVSPYGVALDPDGRLFVVDYSAHRITIYENAAAKANGADADGVLGQPDFTTDTANTGGRSASSLNGPVLAFYDPALPALWVGDSGNNRVLAYGFGITMNTAGSGTGDVSRDPDGQIFGQDSEVTLSADPAYDTYFTGWSQDCSGVNDCSLIMDDYKEVTAAFQGPLYVCSPTLDAAAMPKRCHYTSIADALDAAVPGDVIVVSGVVTESVTVDKSVTIQGMLPGDILPDAVRPAPGAYPVYTPGADPEDITPGTHMALVQAAPGPNSGGGSVFSIAAGVQVTITKLNIRYGDAAQGGGINNAGTLLLDSVTLYANHGDQGGALYNAGTLTVINSTLSGNDADDGASVYNAAAGTTAIGYSTLAISDTLAATNLHNANAAAGSVTVGGSILHAPAASPQCAGDVASGDYNLRHGGACFGTPAANDIVGDPLLGALRDNGGPTLTHNPDALSPAVDAGGTTCAVTVDQRGRARPFDAACDIGAVETGARQLTVCNGCAPDAEALLFTDPHAALYQALAGDTIAFEAGAYTGNFILYKDLTLQHAGIDVATLDPEDPVDVRAILQGSASDLDAQYAALNSLQINIGDPVLTVQSYAYPANSPATPVAASGDVSVTLQDLTVRYGLSRRGGGITNLGRLHLLRTTVAENAAVNELRANGSVAEAAQGGGIYNAGTLTLERSTLSGNRAESYGGGLYNRGASVDEKAHLTLLASTLADNQAAPIPDDHTLVIAGFFGGGDVEFTNPIAEAVSGDRIHFHNQIGNDIALAITPAGVCNRDSINLTAMSMSEVDLICYAGTTSVDVTISGGSDFPDLATTITIRPPGYARAAHALYGSSYSEITVTHTILAHQTTDGPSDGGTTCRVSSSLVHSGGYNLSDDSSCRLWDATDQSNQDARLGPLQDNNQIDFVEGALSGYAHTHALLPDSPAIDQIPPETCDVGNHTLNITSTVMTASLSLTGTQSIQQGDVVQWANARSGGVTLALNDGQADAVLISAAAGASSRQVQFTTPGDYGYTVYDDASRERLGQGTITVLTHTQATDQRGVFLPQRGVTDDYNCDIGAYELQPWIVGEPLPRPPSAVGDQAPLWYLGTGEERESLDKGSNQYPHHAWNMALLQDIALRPSPNDGNATLGDGEMVGVDWKTNPDPIDLTAMTQVGIVEWPDTPQLHVASVPVNLDHDALSDDYNISGATPFKNRDIDTEADVLAMGIFTRDTYASGAAAYTVINWGKGTQSGAALQVQVIQTVDWNTPGVRDMRTERTTCDIGTTLAYGAWDDVDRHEDPEEKSGYVLTGDAYDGARTTIDMLRVQNTVGDLIPPAHNRETREGPIIPVLNLAPTTFANPDPVTGGHDLRVAWYRPDGRNVAWPVKAVGYRCEWPEDPPEIVIASELGSEIGGQPVLSTDYYQDPAVYHQPDPDEPGYSLNDEHALLAASNLGNTAPALYALRTDLTSQPYALLKYLDPRDEDEPKIAVYAVVLTRTATAVTNVLTDAGAVTLLASGGVQAQADEVEPMAGPMPYVTASSTPPALTLRVGDADMPAGSAATLAVEALNARALRSVTVTVQYDSAEITPTLCEANRQDFVEDLYSLSIDTNAPRGIQPMRTVRMRANLAAGTDAVYTWDFGDGVTRIAGAEVSHVYGAMGDYTVQVTADNGHFAGVSTSTTINVTENEDAIAEELPEAADTSCRIETPGELTLVLQTRNKHGLSGNLLLADLSFEAVGAPPTATTTTDLDIATYALQGPAYESLEFGITAGNPIYAPVPMQGLLDMQPCEQSIPDDVENARPFWRDFKGKLWARAAGSMEMLYFYPLQTGFYLDDTHAETLGLGDLTADERVGSCIPWMDQLSQGTVSYADFPEEGDTTRVLPVAYDVTWPPLPALLSVGETVYERAKGGVSGVANQLAVSRIYDDYAPGQWDNDVGKIVVAGQEVTRSLAQLIDPVGEITITLDSLPDVIQTQRLLFGGGLAIAGNKDDRDLALPFSLRSRILYDDVEGELIFRGYYDGSSAAYLKGDPLLLLNVMSLSDKNRLLAICPEGKEDCDTYRAAVEALYHKTHNPRQLDLDKDGTPDQAFLIGVQDADGNGEPEPYEGVGKGKALSAGNAAGVGYITLAYNNDPSAGDLPVSLQVIKVGCTQNHLGEDSTYRGNVLVVQSDNVFDEKLTLRHTGDFGGRPDDFEFEWWLAPVDDTGVSPSQLPASYPWQSWTRLEPGMSELGPEITLEGANPTTLSDNWLIVRYKGYPICGNAYRWSAFAGDPSAKPSEVRAQLAEGWIKRVTNALNPFDTRVADFVSAPVNTNVDMVRQAGPRYEGPIAFNGDPDNLNQIGLIEAYQTVLDRGRSLSIDANINHQGANAALLNVSTRIAALYMLLGNDAYMDALDPTVGLSTDSAFGARSAAMFSFMNQFNASFGLLDEELALLRGRDETLGGVAAAPTYNRLTWNFTNGDGEVAYVTNYNIKDYNEDGLLNEADAALMYPQGHGDAWGHYLTAIKTYYELLRHPSYTWVPRAEPIAVGGAPLVADYYDERRFASAAVNKARAGADVVDLTYRKQFADPDTELYTDPHVDDSDGQQRAWGVADWAKRSGQGAYFDWVVGNAILPPIEERYTDVRKIDRTTVSDLGEIVNQYANIQDQLDKADNNLNPLGLAQGAVLFDLNPALANSTPGGGQTHFEQVYDRALGSLDNAQTLFDYANAMKLAQRDSEAQQRDFVTMITEQDTALINELIELFGYPYDADIGVNGTYPEGYAGPDIYNYDLIDRTEMTDYQKRCIDPDNCPAETTTHIVEYKPMECLEFFVEKIDEGSVAADSICSTEDHGIDIYTETETLDIEYRIGTGLDEGYGRFKPDDWPDDSKRTAPGEIQAALRELYRARLELELAVRAYDSHAGSVASLATKIKDRYEVLERQGQLQEDHKNEIHALESAVMVVEEVQQILNLISSILDFTGETAAKCVPQNVGLAVSVGNPVACVVETATNIPRFVIDKVVQGLGLSIGPMNFSKGVLGRELSEDLFQNSTDWELRQLGSEMGGAIGAEYDLRIDLYIAIDNYNSAKSNYDQVLYRGYRKLAELTRLRKRWAGQISEQRYNDMAYRIFQFEALQKYRQQFDLAQQYTYLTAAAYDYETNLAMTDAANGSVFVREIAVERSLGELQGGSPVVGSGGLAGSMAQMRDNFTVLKGQLGFNNPQYEANRFSLRRELLRLRDGSDAKWQNALNEYYVSNVYANDDVALLAKLPYGSEPNEPGLVIPFDTSVIEGQNFFGQPLGPGDSSYDATQFSTKIAAVGVWFDGYDTTRLAETPRVYLLPAGDDVLRPRNTDNRLRYWNVAEQLLPLPYTLGEAEMSDPSWIASMDGLDGQIFERKPYARFRAYPYTPDFSPDEMTIDTRLIGRSVWNTRWVLVIPGSTLLSDSQQGIDRFIEDVDDVYIYFQTYAYAGTQ